VPWCKYFVPKIASPNVQEGDPNLNDHIMYAKCIKGHVLKDADDWILCENLPSPDSLCWQEGGETIFSLRRKQRTQAQAEQDGQTVGAESAPQRASS
jgi:hypothetical protein